LVGDEVHVPDSVRVLAVRVTYKLPHFSLVTFGRESQLFSCRFDWSMEQSQGCFVRVSERSLKRFRTRMEADD
jgi:hypothetical protein